MKYWYGCDTKLKRAQVPRVDVKPLDTSTTWNETEKIILRLLESKGRQLSQTQLSLVLSKVNVEPTALYMRLAVGVVSKWLSGMSDNTAMHIEGGVRNLINEILESMERDFGKELTRAALGFMTFSVEGVTDKEMCDLLSLDERVLRAVTQYTTSQRVPSHVWLRLREEMAGLVMEQSGGCLRWYHRQLKEAAEDRYEGEERQRLAEIMGRYFSDDELQPLTLNEHDVWFPQALVNKRRCDEAAHHLLKAKMILEAEKELCNLKGVAARAKTRNVFRMVSELIELHQLYPASECTVHYLRWVQQDAGLLSRNPNLVATSCSNQPTISHARQDLHALLESKEYAACSWDNEKVWYRGRRLGGANGFDALVCNMVGHEEWVNGVALSGDGRRVVSCSADKSIRIWNAESG
jgi:hypothetical protein